MRFPFNQRTVLLNLLADEQEHTQMEMVEAGGWRFGAVIHELRNAGFGIETIHKGGRTFHYRWNKQADRAVVA